MNIEHNIKNPYGDQVNVNENYEVEYWANKFNLTPARLKEVIKIVGASAKAIEANLKK